MELLLDLIPSLVIFIGLGVSLSARSLEVPLRSLGFTLPLLALAPRIGVTIQWHLIFLLLLTLRLQVRPEPLAPRRIPSSPLILALVTYAICLTAFTTLAPGHDTLTERGVSLGWGQAQTSLRPIVQTISFLTMWALAVAIYHVCNSSERRASLLSGFIWGCTVSVGLGFLNIALLAGGIRWLSTIGDAVGPLASFAGADAGIRISLAGFEVPRLWGLTGEPKHTAAFALIALASILTAELRGQSLLRRQRLHGLGLGAGILLTQSTGGILGLLAMAMLFLAASLWSSLRGNTGPALKSSARRPVLLLCMSAAIGVLALQAQPQEGLIGTRVYDRLQTAESVRYAEFKDDAFLTYLAEDPYSALGGAGLGNVDFRLIEHSTTTYADGTLTPAYVVTRYLGDLGLVGLVLLLGVPTVWLLFEWNRFGPRSFVLLALPPLLLTSSVMLPAWLVVAAAFLRETSQVGSPRVDLPRFQHSLNDFVATRNRHFVDR